MNNRDGGLAYPQPIAGDCEGGMFTSAEKDIHNGGMTMRQRYKLAALPLAMDDAIDSFEDDEAMAIKIAHTAGLIADAMLAEDEAHEREANNGE